jgi:hypothetical protein
MLVACDAQMIIGVMADLVNQVVSLNVTMRQHSRYLPVLELNR